MRTPAPIDAEARGKLRVWRAQMAAARAAQIRTFHADATFDAARQLALGATRLGRRRARQALIAAFRGAVLEREAPRLLVFAALTPRRAVIVEGRGAHDHPRYGQDCVTVEYIVVGAVPGFGHSGLWTVELPEHCIGRLLQRHPSVDLSATILAAHRALLAAPADAIAAGEFLLPAGPGAFACEYMRGRDPGADGPILYARCWTWLHDDQLGPDQAPIAPAPPGCRTGADLFLPLPLAGMPRAA